MNAIDRSSTQRNDLAGFVGDIERLEAIFETWDETPRAATEAYRRCDRIAERRSLSPAGAGAEERPGRARRDEIRGRRRSRLRGAATARDRQAQPRGTRRDGARKRSPDAGLAWRRRRTDQGDAAGDRGALHRRLRRLPGLGADLSRRRQEGGAGRLSGDYRNSSRSRVSAAPARAACVSSARSPSAPKGNWMFAAISVRHSGRRQCARWRSAARRCCCRARAPSSPVSRTPARISACRSMTARSTDGIITCPHHGFQYDLVQRRMPDRAGGPVAVARGARDRSAASK